MKHICLSHLGWLDGTKMSETNNTDTLASSPTTTESTCHMKENKPAFDDLDSARSAAACTFSGVHNLATAVTHNYNNIITSFQPPRAQIRGNQCVSSGTPCIACILKQSAQRECFAWLTTGTLVRDMLPCHICDRASHMPDDVSGKRCSSPIRP
jgi:hypothetical protein